MELYWKLRMTAVIPCLMTLSPFSAGGAIIASTDFNGRTLDTTLVANDTAANLNWTTNGVANPGNLAAVQWGGTGQALFNNTTLTQNIFAPALNVGNAGSDATKSWTTTINLEVLSGYSVTLESVSFDYWAINGSALQNVDRRSDFTVTLLNPSSTELGSVSVNDVINGTGVSSGSGTAVTLTFSSPIPLVDPGTYTLRIRGGDYAGADETGNHTAIDNLSIHGTAVIPEPSFAMLGLVGLGLLLRRRR